MSKECVIGIDIGGTNTDIGIVTEGGKILRRANLPTANYSDFELYVRELAQLIARIAKEEEIDAIAGIGVGAPNGNFYTGCIDNAPNLKMKGVLDLKREFQKYFNVPVVVSNDANAAAYGEFVYGGAKGMQHFIMFTLGTGVGSGIVIDGKLVHGSTGAAGELGHAILIPEGRDCTCGRKGCLEAYTSARGIVQTFCELRAQENDYQGILKDLPDADITAKQVGDAANKGDAVALQAYRRTGYLLGLAMANAVTFSSPEAIFLMGGPTKVGEPLMRPLRESFERHQLNVFANKVSIHTSELDSNDVAILGAAALLKMTV